MKKTCCSFFYAFLFLFCASLLTTRSAIAAESNDSRTHHRFGAYLGIIEPFPSLVSGNIGINVFSFLRLTGGYGSISFSGTSGSGSITTWGAGGRLFVPGWSFSPTVGLSYASVSVSGNITSGSNVQGFSGNGSHLYIPIGLDWQAMIGFNLGFGYNYSLKSGVGGLPYLTLGWFF